MEKRGIEIEEFGPVEGEKETSRVPCKVQEVKMDKNRLKNYTKDRFSVQTNFFWT